MILVRLSGGLGNQMHQYAFGKLLAEKLQEPLYFEINDIAYNNRKKKYASRGLMLEQVFELPQALSTRVGMPGWINFNAHLRQVYLKGFLLFHNLKPLFQPLYALSDPYYKSISNNTYLVGLWAAYEVLEQNRIAVKEMFRFREETASRFEAFSRECYRKESVAIHVRRGDYLLPQHQAYNICNIAYYQKAISVVREQIKSPYFYIFSDDPNWCRQNFEFLSENEKCIVDFTSSENPGEDLFCMSRCKHFIVANSTFSYWGAFLSERFVSKIVIAPQKWFDINQSLKLPPHWEGIYF